MRLSFPLKPGGHRWRGTGGQAFASRPLCGNDAKKSIGVIADSRGVHSPASIPTESLAGAERTLGSALAPHFRAVIRMGHVVLEPQRQRRDTVLGSRQRFDLLADRRVGKRHGHVSADAQRRLTADQATAPYYPSRATRGGVRTPSRERKAKQPATAPEQKKALEPRGYKVRGSGKRGEPRWNVSAGLGIVCELRCRAGLSTSDQPRPPPRSGACHRRTPLDLATTRRRARRHDRRRDC